jgi:hypothetical protein
VVVVLLTGHPAKYQLCKVVTGELQPLCQPTDLSVEKMLFSENIIKNNKIRLAIDTCTVPAGKSRIRGI